jgi:hypothetical protein
MGLNEIKLPASLVVELYRDNLIENQGGPIVPALQKGQTTKTVQWLGKNQQNICLLVNYENDVYLPDEQLSFLTAILQACKLNLGDVAIVNYHPQKPSFEDLQKQTGCAYLLVFGIDSTRLGLKKMPGFTTAKIKDCTVVLSPEIEQLNINSAEGKLLKSKLWLCLKQLFNV